MLIFCFWACTTTDSQGDQYLKFNLSASLKDYNRVQIRLVSTLDSDVVYDTVWNDTLKDPVNFPRYKLKAAKNKDFVIQIRGYNKDKLSWAKDIKVIGSTPQVPVTLQADVRLYNLILSSGSLQPAFDPEVYAYTVQVPNEMISLAFTFSAVDSSNLLLFGQIPLSWNNLLTQPLLMGSNTFPFNVQSKDGKITKTYTVIVTRGNLVTPIDTSINVTSLIVNPKTLTLYKGDPAASLSATVLPMGIALNWTTLNDVIATVEASGKVIGKDSGSTYILVKAGKKVDSCAVTIKVDVPQVTVGNNVAVKQNTEISFPISITKQHGNLAVFKYDFEGDGWDNGDSLINTSNYSVTLKHIYATLKTYTAKFYIRDVQGNVVNSQRTITISNAANLMVITWPSKDTLVNKTPITLLYTVNGTTLSKQFDLKEGANTLLVSAGTGADSAAATLKVTLDTQAPVIKITSPKDSTYLNLNTADITWTADGVVQTVQLKADLGTTDGIKIITRELTDAAGNVGSTSIRIYRKTTFPVVAITAPADGFITNQNSITVAWSVDGINQNTQTTDSLIEGLNTVTRKFTDAAGNVGTKFIKITRITTGPLVKINSPSDGLVTNQVTVPVNWSVDGVKQTSDTSVTLVDGLNIIKRSATDKAGNKSVDSVKIILNTKVPNVQITSPAPGAITNQTSINVTWTVNGVAQTASLEPLLVEGDNIIIRKFKDAASNEGIASIKVIRDTKPPAVVILSPLSNAFTNASKIKVVWTVDGEVQTQNDSENITTEGSITIKRQFTDAANNKDSASVTIIRDATKPNAPVLSTANALTNGDAVWTWADGGGDAGSGLKPATYQYQINAGTITALSTNSLTLLKNNLSDGPYSLVVQQQDLAGNWSANSNAVIITVDKTPPTQPVINASSPTNVQPKWNWSSGGNGGSGDYRYKLGDENFSTGATTGKDSTITLVTAAVTGTTYILYVQERDAAGNWSKSSSLPIVYDLTKPTIAILSPQASGTYIDTTDGVKLSGTASAILPNAIVKVTYKIGIGASTDAVYTAGTWSIANIPLINGTNTVVTVTAIDNVNNTADAVLSLLMDKTIPSPPTITSAPSAKTKALLGSWIWAAGNDGTNGSGLNGNYRYNLNDGAWNQTNTALINGLTLIEGNNVFSLQEQDNAKNWSSSITSLVKLDVTGPAITFTNPSSSGTTISTSHITLTGTAIDVGCSVNSATVSGQSLGNTNLTFTGSSWTSADLTLAQGPNTLTVTAIDSLGNSKALSTVINVAVAIPIVTITSPANNFLTNQSNISVIYKVNNGADQTQTVALNTEGNNSITITSPANEVGVKGSTTFNVIRDQTPPNPPSDNGTVAVTNGNAIWNWVSTSDNGGGGGLKSPAIYELKIDNGVPFSSPPNTFTFLLNASKEGTHTLAIREQDKAGNWSSSKSINVVVDITPPNPIVIRGTTPTNTNPRWTWKSNGGSGAFRVKINSSDFTSGTTDVNALEYTQASPFSDIPNTLWVQEKDAAGNWSTPSSYPITYAINTPMVTILSPQSSGTYVDTLASIVLSGSANAPSGITQIGYSTGGQPTIISSGGSWTTNPFSLSEGSPLTVQVIAWAGNGNSIASSLTLLRDNSKPKAPTLSAITSPINGMSMWSWSSNGDVGAGLKSPATYRYFLDGSTTPVTIEATNFTQSSGTHTLAVQQQDLAGNWSLSSATVQIVVVP